MKIFSLEFLNFPGLDTFCRLCNEQVKNTTEEIIVPTLFYGGKFEGAICEVCYRELPSRINSTRLQKFAG
jgi:uncharacterized protein with PIN domain